MKILPFCRSAEPFVHEDGTVELAPFQVFRSPNGGTVMRLGRNTYWFDEQGRYTGCECGIADLVLATPRVVEVEAIQRAYEVSHTDATRRVPPAPYFLPGTDRDEFVRAERAGWPKEPAKS